MFDKFKFVLVRYIGFLGAVAVHIVLRYFIKNEDTINVRIMKTLVGIATYRASSMSPLLLLNGLGLSVRL